MEEKASQCAQVRDIKEASLSCCEGNHDRNLVSYVPLLCPRGVFHTLPAVGMRISLQMH